MVLQSLYKSFGDYTKCFIIIIIIIIILLFWEFFTPALADSFSLEFEWQQDFSSLQVSSQYSC